MQAPLLLEETNQSRATKAGFLCVDDTLLVFSFILGDPKERS